MRVIPLVAAAMAISATAIAQRRMAEPLGAGTSAIRGTVTDAMTKEPIPNCSVDASSATRMSRVTTGPDGTYEFAGIADGNYFLMIRCPSHLTGCLKPNESKGRPCSQVTLFRDQQRTLDMKLTPGGIIRGRVVDAAGNPIVKAVVRLGRPLTGEPAFMITTTQTQDDGAYELRNVAAGEWPIEVDLPQSPAALRPPIVYYPGALTLDDAGAVEVATGAVKDNVTITVPRLLDSSVTVQVPAPDATMSAVNVTLIRVAPLASYRIDIDGNGQGAIKGLIQGRYFVTATAMSAQKAWAAFQGFDFIGDPVDVFLNLEPVGTIRGRVISERDGMPAIDGARIAAVWVEDDVPINPIAPHEGVVAADGTFEINGLFGRRVLQLIGFDPDWRIASVREGRSELGTGIDVTPNTITELTVVVRPRSQR